MEVHCILFRFDRYANQAVFAHRSRTRLTPAKSHSQSPITSTTCTAHYPSRHLMSAFSSSSLNETSIERDDLIDTIRFFISVDQPLSTPDEPSADDIQCRHQHIQTSSKTGSGTASAARRSCSSPEAEPRRSRASSQADVTSSVRWQSALIRLLLLGVDVLLIMRRLVRLYFRLSIWRLPKQPMLSSSSPYTLAGCRSDDEKAIPVIGLTEVGHTLTNKRPGRNYTATPTATSTGNAMISATSNGQHSNNSCGSSANGSLTTTIAGRNHSPLTAVHSADCNDRLGQLAAGMEFCQIGCSVDLSGTGKTEDDTCKSPTSAGLARFYDVSKKDKGLGNCCPVSACCCCCSLLAIVFSGNSARRRHEPPSAFENNGGGAAIPRLVIMAATLAALFYVRTITSHAVADGGVLRLLHGGVEPTIEDGRDFDNMERKIALDDVIASASNDLVHLQSFVEFFNNGKQRTLQIFTVESLVNLRTVYEDKNATTNTIGATGLWT